MSTEIVFEQEGQLLEGWHIDDNGLVYKTSPAINLWIGCRVLDHRNLQEGERLDIVGPGSKFPITVKHPIKSIKHNE